MSIILTKYGNTVAITTNTNKVFYMSVKVFLNAFSLNARGPEGAQLLLNPNFTGGATSWTLGAGWTYGTDKVTHTAGTNPLFQAGAVVAGERYVVRLTVTGTTGSVTVNIGGNDIATINAGAGAVMYYFIATAPGSNLIAITPTNDFNGSIDGVTLRTKSYYISMDTDRLDEQNHPLSAWTIAGHSGMTTVQEVGNAIAALVKYDS